MSELDQRIVFRSPPPFGDEGERRRGRPRVRRRHDPPVVRGGPWERPSASTASSTPCASWPIAAPFTPCASTSRGSSGTASRASIGGSRTTAPSCRRLPTRRLRPERRQEVAPVVRRPRDEAGLQGRHDAHPRRPPGHREEHRALRARGGGASLRQRDRLRHAGRLPDPPGRLDLRARRARRDPPSRHVDHQGVPLARERPLPRPVRPDARERPALGRLLRHGEPRRLSARRHGQSSLLGRAVRGRARRGGAPRGPRFPVGRGRPSLQTRRVVAPRRRARSRDARRARVAPRAGPVGGAAPRLDVSAHGRGGRAAVLDERDPRGGAGAPREHPNPRITGRVNSLLAKLGYRKRKHGSEPRTYYYERRPISPACRPAGPASIARLSLEPSQGDCS